MSILGIIAASGKGAVTFYVYGSGTPAVHGTFIPDGFYNGFPRYARLDSLLMVWGTEDGEYVISDYGNYNIANCYFRNNKQTGVTPWEGTNWMAVEGSGVPTVSLTPPPVVTIYVSYAGSAALNGVYVETGTYGGMPLYISQDGLRMIWWDGAYSRYRFGDLGVYDRLVSYYSDDNGELDPWKSTAWSTNLTVASDPSPWVTLAPFPTVMRITGSGSVTGQPLDVPYFDRVNGKPRYFLEENRGVSDQTEIVWGPAEPVPPYGDYGWRIYVQGRNRLRYSCTTENVNLPSEVIYWTVDFWGSLPLPTVTAVY